MDKHLAPAFIELTQDTLLKVFWYKPTLRLFLQQYRIKESVLASWHPDQSKREYLTWLWSNLVKTERGKEAILEMATSLAEMVHFPDLERKEDTKIRIHEAKEAVRRLKVQVEKINEALEERAHDDTQRKLAAKKSLEHLAAKQSIEKLEKQLYDITPKIGTSEGGKAFEKWFYDLSVYFELDARPSYKVESREIDGAVTIEETTYLIETKFLNKPVGSPEIDIFMAKIESKADNTMGLFVSMSGFSEGAKNAASKHKTPMLLLDHAHIFSLILRGVMKLPEVVKRIKRHASQTGISYLEAQNF